MDYYPLIVMAIGIALVVGMIMWMRLNAFIALITAAMVVSLLAFDTDPDTGKATLAGNAISRVAVAFGGACGNIGVVIALDYGRHTFLLTAFTVIRLGCPRPLD